MPQKLFTVYHSPLAVVNKLLLATAIMLLFQNCSFNPPLQKKGEVEVQGVWQQDTTLAYKKLVTYSLYNFTFNCDSFFVEIKSFSKVNYGADTCMSAGKWTEYAKGNYALSHDTLRLKGQFCNADYSLKKDGGCFRYGNYDESFKIKKTTDSVYQYLNLSATVPFNVYLKKKSTCIPKPL